MEKLTESLSLEAQGGRAAGDALRDQAIHVVEGGLFDIPGKSWGNLLIFLFEMPWDKDGKLMGKA